MTATPQQVDAFVRSGTALACKVSGSLGGAVIGTLIAGPPGALIGAAVGPFVEQQLTTLTGELLTRRISERERLRASAGAILIAENLDTQFATGRTLRSGDFQHRDESGRSPADELTEQVILSIMDSVEERRIPYLANLYSSLYFDEEISRSSIASIVSIATDLNYKSMCILSVVHGRTAYTGRQRPQIAEQPWSVGDHIVAQEAFKLINASIVVNKTDEADHHDTILGYLDVEPGTMQLSALGTMICTRMKLNEIPSVTDDLIEIKESLSRIALSPSGNWSLDGGEFERALDAKPYERLFSEKDWTSVGSGFNITIYASDHGKGKSPSINVERLSSDNIYQLVGLGQSVAFNGDIVLEAGLRFEGRFLIR